MKRFFACLLLLSITAICADAQQRPLMTDDVDITPEGAVNIGAGVDFFQNAKFPLSGLKGDQTRVGDIRVKVGFASNVEFQVEGVLQNFLAINSQTASLIPLDIKNNSSNDTGDFTLSTKIKLENETDKMPALGFKFGFQLPNSNQARGIGTNQLSVFGKIIAQKHFGNRVRGVSKVNIFGNLGLAIIPAPLSTFTQNDVLIYGIAGIYRLNQRINLVSEVNGRANTRSGTAPLGTESLSQFRVGTQIRASGLRFDTAAAFGLTKNSPRTGIIFGVTYQTPNIFTPAK